MFECQTKAPYNSFQYVPLEKQADAVNREQLLIWDLSIVGDTYYENDTGPRHIAIALDKNVISLFGPNNPSWTRTGHVKEIQIMGQAPCVPCDQPSCRVNLHLCMESISVDEVFDKAVYFLEKMRNKPLHVLAS